MPVEELRALLASRYGLLVVNARDELRLVAVAEAVRPPLSVPAVGLAASTGWSHGAGAANWNH